MGNKLIQIYYLCLYGQLFVRKIYSSRVCNIKELHTRFNGQEIVNEVKLIISRFKEINSKNSNWFDYAIISFSDEEHIKNISNYMVKTSSRSYDPLLRFTNKRLPVTQL